MCILLYILQYANHTFFKSHNFSNYKIIEQNYRNIQVKFYSIPKALRHTLFSEATNSVSNVYKKLIQIILTYLPEENRNAFPLSVIITSIHKFKIYSNHVAAIML